MYERKKMTFDRHCIMTALWVVMASLSMLEAQSGQINIQSEVDKSTITIGELIQYKVKVTHTPELEVHWPSLGSNLGAFEIRDYKLFEPVEENGQLSSVIRYTISTFDTGSFVIPPLIIDYASKNDSARQQIQSEPLLIYIKSLNPSQDGDIRGLKNQSEVSRDFRTIILIASLVLLLFILAVVGFIYYRKKKQGISFLEKPAPPPLPPHVIALQKLDELKKKQIYIAGESKAYFSELSEIMREYIAGRFAVITLEVSTFELLQELKNKQPNLKEVSSIESVLSTCDLAKFAKYKSNEAEAISTMESAYTVVHATKIVDESDTQTNDGPADKPAEATALPTNQNEDSPIS